VTVQAAERPGPADVEAVLEVLARAVQDIGTCTDLGSRLGAPNRALSSEVRQRLREQW
jgi:malonate decarboxylase gamma subunit